MDPGCGRGCVGIELIGVNAVGGWVIPPVTGTAQDTEEADVGIGAAIFLIAVGAIITFAVDLQVDWLNLEAVGWVLMVAGVVGLILTLTVFRRRRRVVTSAPVTERHVVEESAPTVEYDSDQPRY